MHRIRGSPRSFGRVVHISVEFHINKNPLRVYAYGVRLNSIGFENGNRAVNSTVKNTYTKNEVTRWPIPNYWDAIALVLMIAILFLFGWAATKMLGQYHPGVSIPISLNPTELPYYALRSVLRMFIALFFSLLFTFIFATWAAKSHQAERLIIPMIDVFQSVPILGLLPMAVVVFVRLFPNSLLGMECAAIFAIFTAQVWNMALSFYQSLRTLPDEMREAARMFQLSGWQKFWRIEVPFAMPGLLWNTMLSMSGSWIYLVASEAITVGGRDINLPGIGSYIGLAIQQKDTAAIGYVILAMFVVIALYDQLLFRPLVAWAEKFKAEEIASEIMPESWILNLFQRTRLFRFFGYILSNIGDGIVNNKIFSRPTSKHFLTPNYFLRKIAIVLWNIIIAVIVMGAVYILIRFIFTSVSLEECLYALYLGLITAIRVTIVILLSSIIWVPIGVWVGLSPRASQIVQPIAQFFAAFPANLLFPIVTIAIVRYDLNVNIWTSPLMILGTQWYILFNVIAGTIAIPKNLRQAAGTLNVGGWLWWKRLILPSIFPYYITGAITAAGGAWNISIIAEAVNWGNIQLRATGLGAFITDAYNQGDFPRLALGVAVMSLYVLMLNRVMWRPLYNLAEEKFQIK